MDAGVDNIPETQALDPESAESGPQDVQPTVYASSYNAGAEEESPFVDEYAGISWEELRGVRKRRLVCLLCTICGVVALSVGLGVGVSNSNTSSADSSTEATLARAPPDLETMCAPTNLETQDGYSACLHACQPSQCCELVDTNPFSCIDTNREECATYHASCQHLGHKKAADAASGQVVVDQACSTIALSTEEGVGGCKSVCEDFMCCFQGPEDYIPCDVSQAWCADYAACSALNYVDEDGFDTHQEVKESIADACSDVQSPEGNDKCQHICRPAQCCFATIEYSGDSNCNAVNCTHYAACSAVYGPQEEPESQGGGNEPPAHQTTEESEEEGGGTHQTTEESEEGGGTHETTEESAEETDDDTDDDFDPELIQGDDDDYEDYEESPHDACDEKSASNLDSFRECHEHCHANLCCFGSENGSADTPPHCKDKRPDQCEAHKECSILVDSDLSVSFKETVDHFCSSELIATEDGFKECHRQCAKHLCCFESSDSPSRCGIPHEGDEGCDIYDSCRILIGDSEGGGGGTHQTTEESEEGGGTHQTTEESAEASQNTCDEDSASNLESFRECHEHCHENLCCFGSEDGSADTPPHCKDQRPEQCEAHKDCSFLVDSDVSVSFKETVDHFCASDLIATEDGFKECHRQCAKHLCCFESSESPSSCGVPQDGDESCDIYSSCRNLIEDGAVEEGPTGGVEPSPTGEGNSLTEELAQVCNLESVSTLAGFHKCYDECYYHLCCFIDESSPEASLNCRNEKEDECLQYSACAIIMEADIHGSTREAVDEACMSDNVDTVSGFQECHRLCAAHLCCFQDEEEPSSCVNISGDECDIYKKCAFLATTENHPNPFVDDDPYLVALVEESCTEEKLETEGGRADCGTHCLKRSCCFTEGPENCRETKKEWCEEVSACDLLFDPSN